MNWVGGWRSRVMKSNDTKKQKEFFEKMRMQRRRSLLSPPPAASLKGGHDSNVDLLTMFIVNQIALKKANTGKPKVTNLSDSETSRKSLGGRPVELPMSPCSPSRLSLAQSEPLHSDQGADLKKRRHRFLDELRFRMLSPLLETNMSDNSASESQHPVQDCTSMFSSSSSTPPAAFSLHTRPTELISPASVPEPQSTNTSQGFCEFNPWSTHQTHPMPTDGAQFGSTLYSRDTNRPSIHSSECTLNDSQQNEEEEQLFVGLNSEEYGGEDSDGEYLFSSTRTKIHLQHMASPKISHGTCKRDHADFISQGEPNKQCSQAGVSHLSMLCPSVTPVNCSKPGMSAARVLSFSQNVPSNTDQDVQTRGVLESWFNTGQGRDEEQFVPLHCQTITQTMCKTASPRTRDQDTQTAHSTSRDASVQCRLLKTPRRYSLRKASATRRQTGQSKPRLGSKTRFEVKWNAPSVMMSREPAQQGPETINGPESSHDAENQGSLHCSHTNAPAENMLVKEIRREGLEHQSANNTIADKPECTAEHDGAADTSRNSASKGTKGVYEIADILLMLRQKNKHP